MKGWHANIQGQWHKIRDVEDIHIPHHEEGGGDYYHVEGLDYPVHHDELDDMQEHPPAPEKPSKPFQKSKKDDAEKDELMRIFQGDDSDAKLKALRKRKNITPEHLIAAIRHDNDRQATQRATRHRNATPDVLQFALALRGRGTWGEIAKHKNATEDQLKHILRNGEWGPRKRIMNREDLSADVVNDTKFNNSMGWDAHRYKHGDTEAIKKHTRDVLDKFNKGDLDGREMYEMNNFFRRMPPEDVEHGDIKGMVEHGDRHTISALMNNFKLFPSTYTGHQRYEDKSHEHGELLHHVLNSNNPGKIAAMLNNGSAGASLLLDDDQVKKVAEHEHPSVRKAAAKYLAYHLNRHAPHTDESVENMYGPEDFETRDDYEDFRGNLAEHVQPHNWDSATLRKKAFAKLLNDDPDLGVRQATLKYGLWNDYPQYDGRHNHVSDALGNVHQIIDKELDSASDEDFNKIYSQLSNNVRGDLSKKNKIRAVVAHEWPDIAVQHLPEDLKHEDVEPILDRLESRKFDGSRFPHRRTKEVVDGILNKVHPSEHAAVNGQLKEHDNPYISTRAHLNAGSFDADSAMKDVLDPRSPDEDRDVKHRAIMEHAKKEQERIMGQLPNYDGLSKVPEMAEHDKKMDDYYNAVIEAKHTLSEHVAESLGRVLNLTDKSRRIAEKGNNVVQNSYLMSHDVPQNSLHNMIDNVMSKGDISYSGGTNLTQMAKKLDREGVDKYLNKDYNRNLTDGFVENPNIDTDQLKRVLDKVPEKHKPNHAGVGIKHGIESHEGSQTISFPFNAGKLRELRDAAEKKGGTIDRKSIKQMNMRLPHLGIGHLSNPKDGSISAEDIGKHIDSLPRQKYTYRYQKSNMQQQMHNKEVQDAFKVSLHPDSIQRLKDEGLYNSFLELGSAAEPGIGSHPQDPHTGLGWVRYTKGEDRNIHIDEIQSDLGRKMIHKRKEWHPDKMKKLKDIVFGGKHPAEALHEAFLQHMREQGHVGNKFELFTSESKRDNPQLGGLQGKEAPVHHQNTYNEIPKKLGYKDSEYGSISTQNSGAWQGLATRQHTLKKRQIQELAHILQKAVDLEDMELTDKFLDYFGLDQWITEKAMRQLEKTNIMVDEEADGKKELEEGKEPLDKDKLKGGLADKSKASDFDSKELAIGIKHEMEHTDDKEVAKEIAMDHLKEDPAYYSNMQKSAISSRWDRLKKALDSESAIMSMAGEDIPDEEGSQDDEEQFEDGQEEEQPDGQEEEMDEGEDPEMDQEQDPDAAQDDALPDGEESPEGGEEGPSEEELVQMLQADGYSDTEIAHVLHGHTVPEATNDQIKQNVMVGDAGQDRENKQRESDLKHALTQKEAEMKQAHAQRMSDLEFQSKQNEMADPQTEKGHRNRMLDLEYENAKKDGAAGDIDIEHKKRMLELEYQQAQKEQEMELAFKQEQMKLKLKHEEEGAKHKMSMQAEKQKHQMKEHKKNMAADAAKTSAKEKKGK